jgi:outer membrane biosynthesis protein TonB
MEDDMRKFILITAMVLVSASAHAGGQRSLTLASSDEPAKSVETQAPDTTPADTKPAEATPTEAPKYIERPAVTDTQPATQCQPAAPTTADAPKVTPRQVATTEKPKRRHQSTEGRIISELHRHGIYW